MRSFVKGLVSGGLVGGTLALLFTPRNGKGNRRYLREIADAHMDLELAVEDLKDETEILKTSGKTMAKDTAEGIQNSVQDYQKNTEENRQGLKSKWAKLKSDLNKS